MEFPLSSYRSRQNRGYSTYPASSPFLPHSVKTKSEHLFTSKLLFQEIENMENPLQKNLRDSCNIERSNVNMLGEKLETEKIITESHKNIENSNSQKNTDSSWLYVSSDIFFGFTNIITGLFKHITSSVVHPVGPNDQNTEKQYLKTENPSLSVDMDLKDPEFDEWSHDELDASPPINKNIQLYVPLDSSINSIKASASITGSDLAQCSARGGRAGSPARDIMPLPALVDPAETCQAKMAKIKELLAGKQSATKTNKNIRYRPKKIFIDPKFIQEKAVEPFMPENLGRLESVDTTDFINPGVFTPSLLMPAETLPRVKLETDPVEPLVVKEHTNNLLETERSKQNLAQRDHIDSTECLKLSVGKICDIDPETDSVKNRSFPVVENGECNNIKHIDVVNKDKRIPTFDDLDESTDLENTSSVENSPKIVLTPPKDIGFNEFCGKFQSKSPQDEYVIVFSDGPVRPPPRERIPSDTSDDSFIVFEDDAEGPKPECFIVDNSCESDTESDKDSNLDRMGRFSHTQMDLTDENLYHETNTHCTNEKERLQKKVRFSDAPPEVRVMRVWDYASRQARVSNWRQQAADAERFKRRVADIEMAISWVLKPQHRNRVKFQRFMPWWHQQRRIEEAERQAEEERREREERERLEEELRIEMEVRQEFENSRKKRKKVSTQQFARNFAAYILKKKQDEESQKDVSPAALSGECQAGPSDDAREEAEPSTT